MRSGPSVADRAAEAESDADPFDNVRAEEADAEKSRVGVSTVGSSDVEAEPVAVTVGISTAERVSPCEADAEGLPTEAVRAAESVAESSREAVLVSTEDRDLERSNDTVLVSAAVFVSPVRERDCDNDKLPVHGMQF